MTEATLRKDSTVGVLLPSALTESFEIALARIADLDGDGVRVVAIVCNGAVKGCVSNPIGFEGVCRHCRSVRDQALACSAAAVPKLSLDADFTAARPNLTKEETEELEAGVNSTILTFYRGDAETSARRPLRRWIYQKLARRFTDHSLFVRVAMGSLLASRRVDRIEFFNGRIVPTRAALQAARQTGCGFGVLEVSGRDRHLTVAENSSVHDIMFKQAELRRFLARTDMDLQAGSVFFESRRKGEETNDRSFTARQKQGHMQSNGKPVLAIFTSSADELKVSGAQWFTPASADPTAFIIALAKEVHSDFRIVVRMHPNQAGDKTGAALAMVRALSAVSHIELIPPTSVASTYELLDAAEAVLTFGSTIGLEATYWGKPSILAGRALWDQQDIAYPVHTPQEAAALLASHPTPRSREDALAVGSYYIVGTGLPGSLTWREQGITGFSVNGRSYISLKRAAASYWMTRVVDRLLKKF